MPVSFLERSVKAPNLRFKIVPTVVTIMDATKAFDRQIPCMYLWQDCQLLFGSSSAKIKNKGQAKANVHSTEETHILDTTLKNKDAPKLKSSPRGQFTHSGQASIIHLSTWCCLHRHLVPLCLLGGGC